MVVELRGMIDGRSVVFTRTRQDSWATTIPADLDGEYIVELTAVDEAGNEGYYATMLFTIDTSALCVHIEPLRYYSSIVDESHLFGICDQNFSATYKESDKSTEIVASGYYVTVVEPKCERRLYG